MSIVRRPNINRVRTVKFARKLGQLFRAAWQEALTHYVLSEKFCPFQQLFSTSTVYNRQFFKGAICEKFAVLHQTATLVAGQASRNRSVWKYAAAEWSVSVWREQLRRQTRRCCSDRSEQVSWPRSKRFYPVQKAYQLMLSDSALRLCNQGALGVQRGLFRV